MTGVEIPAFQVSGFLCGLLEIIVKAFYWVAAVYYAIFTQFGFY